VSAPSPDGGPPRFHLAFPVHDLAAARAFYGGLLGCREGRSAPTWVDFDFFGHQLVAHLHPAARDAGVATNLVDGDDVPIAHFGVVLAWSEWETWRDRLAAAGLAFRVAPHVRFRGAVGEQATLFVLDPSGNALELKAFRDPSQLFARPPAARGESAPLP
jgi:hypothetical protein